MLLGHSGHCPCWFIKLTDKRTVSKVIFLLNMNTFQILLVLQVLEINVEF